MKRIITGMGYVALTIIFTVSFAIFAGTEMAGAQTYGASTTTCTDIPHSLWLGQYGTNVTALQVFLYNKGYLTRTPTGFYGPATFTAVSNYQNSHNITGTGTVGPLTRATIKAETCSGTPTPNPTMPVSIYSVSPQTVAVYGTVTISGSGFTSDNTINFAGSSMYHIPASFVVCGSYPSCSGNQGSLSFTIPSSVGPNCPVGGVCAMYQRLITPGVYPISVSNANGSSNTINITVTDSGDTSGNSLYISGVDAPASVPMSTQATWTVHAASRTNTGGSLHYNVTWGDEAFGAGAFAPNSSQVYSTATFTHQYYRAGSYNPTFTVTDDFGHSASASVSVLVTPMY